VVEPVEPAPLWLEPLPLLGLDDELGSPGAFQVSEPRPELEPEP
jgi:hypothetical protein